MPRFFLAALGLAGAGAVLLATGQYGAGLSPDAVGYIGVARQLLAGQGVVGYEGQPFVIQPPLFPMLLALGGWIGGTDPLLVAPLCNALICGAVVYLTGLLGRRYQQVFPTLVPFVPAFALLSWPLFSVGVMAWSEPLFIGLGLLCLLSLGLHLEKGALGPLAAAAGFAGMACLTRYIGLTFILGGGMIVLIYSPLTWRRRMAHLLFFGAAAALPLIVWVARNHLLTGTLLGPRYPAAHSLGENLVLTLCGLSAFFVPEVLVPQRLMRLGLGALSGLTVAAAGWGWLRASSTTRNNLSGLGPVGIWAAVYALFLIASSTTTAYDDINLRLLAPLYAPGVVLLLGVAQCLEERGWHRAVRAGLVLLLLLPLIGISWTGARYAREGAGAGTGTDRYNTAPWHQSETIRYLQQEPLQGPIYSNAPDALYILCGLRAAWGPRQGAREVWPKAGQLIWLGAVQRKYLVGPEELQTHVGLDLVARFADGSIYEIAPKEE